MPITKRVRNVWDAFFYSESSPVNLCVSRFFFFGYLFYLYRGKSPSAWAEVPSVFWMPISFFDAFNIGVLPQESIAVLSLIWKAALLLSCLGLMTRVSTSLSFFLSIYLLGLPHNFGKIHHSDALIVVILGILALSRCGDAFSFDRVFKFMPNRHSPKSIKASAEYTWPVRTCWLALCLVFFAAGVAKLRYSGLAWIFSDNMANILLLHHYFGNQPVTNLGLYLAQSEWICWLIAGTTLLFELTAPAALISKASRRILVPGLLLLQLGIALLLDVWFRPFFAAYLFWIPWHDAYRWLKARAGTRMGSTLTRLFYILGFSA